MKFIKQIAVFLSFMMLISTSGLNFSLGFCCDTISTFLVTATTTNDCHDSQISNNCCSEKTTKKCCEISKFEIENKIEKSIIEKSVTDSFIVAKTNFISKLYNVFKIIIVQKECFFENKKYINTLGLFIMFCNLKICS